jgi:hypothetical protein
MTRVQIALMAAARVHQGTASSVYAVTHQADEFLEWLHNNETPGMPPAEPPPHDDPACDSDIPY